MSNTKRLQQLHCQEPPRKRHTAMLIGSLLILLCGIWWGWDDSSSVLDVPDWAAAGPVIEIAAEVQGGDLSVWCSVEKEGIFTLHLQGGQHFEEAAQVWVLVQDLSFPFRWEIVDGEVTYRVLSLQDTDGNVEADGYPDNRKYVSEVLGFTSGESVDLLGMGCNTALFAADIEPGAEGSCMLQFQMDPNHAEYRVGNDIIIRMPWIINSRGAPVYQMMPEDFKELIDAGSYNMLPQFSNFMIDGIPMFETMPVIKGDYFSEYTYNPDIVINSIYPEPSEVIPSVSWQDRLQWIPYLSFHNLNDDRSQFFYTWLSGLLIAVGSGLLVLPLANWLPAEGKQKGDSKTAKRKNKNT